MAHPELDALFNTLLPFAQTMLREHGEFYPFGAIMTSSGEIRHVGVKIEDDDHPASQPLIDLVTDTFKKQATKGELRAAGICYDVLTVPPGEHQKRDAVCCCLEHYSGETVNVFVPYVKAADGEIRGIWVPSPENRDVRQLLWHRHRLVQMRTRIMNQLQALAMNEGRARVNGQLMLTVRLESRWRRARFGGKMYLASHVERPGSNWVGEDR